MSKFEKNRIFILNEPNAPRVNPALACEVGFNEHMVLLQLEFLVAVKGKALRSREYGAGIEQERKQEYEQEQEYEYENEQRQKINPLILSQDMVARNWIYMSVRDWVNIFPWWSKDTISRAIASLEKQGLVFINKSGEWNAMKYDKTWWYALNLEGLSKLKSIHIKRYETRSPQNETGSAQNETGFTQNETRLTQDETTIPENIPENILENETENKLPGDATRGSSKLKAKSGWCYIPLPDHPKILYFKDIIPEVAEALKENRFYANDFYLRFWRILQGIYGRNIMEVPAFEAIKRAHENLDGQDWYSFEWLLDIEHEGKNLEVRVRRGLKAKPTSGGKIGKSVSEKIADNARAMADEIYDR